MRLVGVYGEPSAALWLYALLGDREPQENISHKRMPTWREHMAFVESEPYEYWALIENHGSVVGAIYLSKQREIGIHLFKEARGQGIGEQAIALLREQYPGPVLANVNVHNAGSIRFFERIGFVPLQVTLATT